jgi:L-ribulose-5-phosphate 3-epimerase
MNGYRLGIYEKAMPDTLSWNEKFAAAKHGGFDFIEISIDETDEKISRLDMSIEERNKLCASMKKENIYIETMCLSAHRRFPMGSEIPAKRDKAMEIMEKAIAFARDIGIRVVQLAGYDVYYETANEQTRELFANNLKKSVDIAATCGIILAIENVDTKLINSVEMAMYWVEKINSPYLSVYPDIGNLTAVNTLDREHILDDIYSGKGHIVAVHLKDTLPGKFRNIPFGKGQVDFDKCIQMLYALGVRMYLAEFWYDGRDDWQKNIAETNKYLRSYFE